MLGRSKINVAAPKIRSSFADAAFAVEERVVWGGVDLLRSLFDAVKWPFERIVWTVERGLVWPLEERTGGWSGSARAGGVGALALLAAAAGALGLVLASGGGSSAPVREVSAPVAQPAPVATQAPPAPILHGAAPDFTPEAGDTATKASSGTAADAVATSSPSSSSATQAATADEVANPGPAAIDVARRFSNAFVLYETGRTNAKVRAAFETTASPKLTRELLSRPPRLPANVDVPKAKVLNVVPGPREGDAFTLSASLLRVGVTSELRLEVQQDERSGEWQVESVRG